MTTETPNATPDYTDCPVLTFDYTPEMSVSERLRFKDQMADDYRSETGWCEPVGVDMIASAKYGGR